MKEKTPAEKIMHLKARETALNQLSRLFVQEMMELGMFRTCINCKHWIDGNEICEKFNERPPAKVIVVGCEAHEDSDIPF